MKTFNEGDRVSHPVQGEGTVINPYPGTGWPTIQFDSGAKMMTDDIMLTLVPTVKFFAYGDRVHHQLHGEGKTLNSFPHANLQQVLFDNATGTDQALGTLVHPVSLTAVVEPTYHICIEEITGAAHVPGNLTAKEVAKYITHDVDWRVALEIKITKEG